MQHRARKRFGQNFLIDKQIIDAIVSAIAPSRAEHLVEIGPGLGALTFPLLRQAKKMTAIEVDNDLIDNLQAKASLIGALDVINADVLTVDFAQWVGSLTVVGNLPYNISTPILMHLLDVVSHIDTMFFMLQLEVVDRLCAEPGTKAYGRLSVMVQYLCDVDAVLTVPPTAFKPTPKVDSAVVRLVPYKNSPYESVPLGALSRLVKAAFATRRKTLRNNLKGLLAESDFLAADIDPVRRAETLTIAEFVRLTQQLKE